MPCADIAHTFEVSGGRDYDAGLALYRLGNESDGVFRYRRLKRRGVAVFYLNETRRKRGKAVSCRAIGAHGDDCNGSAVKIVFVRR